MTVETFKGSGICSGHERYLPMSTKDECGAIAPGPIPFECTRLPQHEGDHVAHGTNMRQFARWPKDGAA